jgi:16S rRNA (uracil1498-N3)-methyltransferase
VNCILLEPNELDARGLAEFAGARALHIRRVLRLRPGDDFRAGIVDGPLGTGRVRAIREERVLCSFAAAGPLPERPSVNLVLALPRPKVMKRLWAPLAALGVHRIVLIGARRVERMYFDSHAVRPEFVRPLLIEGLRQAVDTRLPVVSVLRDPRDLFRPDAALFGRAAARFIAHPGAEGFTEKATRPLRGPVWLAIGPEGGWSEREIGLFRNAGFDPVSFGSRVLRTDVACLLGVGMLSVNSVEK